MRFQKYPFSSRRKRSKIFSSTLAFFVSFSPVHTKMPENDETTGTWDCACVNYPPSWIHAPIWTGTDGTWCFLRHRFQLSTLQTERFQNSSPNKLLSTEVKSVYWKTIYMTEWQILPIPACCEKYLKDNKHNSLHLALKICSAFRLGYIICSSKLTVFLELRSRKTVCFSEQIMSAEKYLSLFSLGYGRTQRNSRMQSDFLETCECTCHSRELRNGSR